MKNKLYLVCAVPAVFIGLLLLLEGCTQNGSAEAPVITVPLPPPELGQDDEAGRWVDLNTTYNPQNQWANGVRDADTIRIDNGTEDGESVRLLCIDAPERGQAWFAEGRDRLRELLVTGKVYLRWDSRGQRDRYGRLLAYVSTYQDGSPLDLADVLVSEGLAKVYESYPCDYTAFYREVEADAQAAGLGIWSEQ